MSSPDVYLALAIVLSFITAALFAVAAILVQPRYRRARTIDRRRHYRASDSTIPAARR